MHDDRNFVFRIRRRREGRESIPAGIRFFVDFLYRFAVKRDIFLQIHPRGFVHDIKSQTFGQYTLGELNHRIGKLLRVTRHIPAFDGNTFRNVRFLFGYFPRSPIEGKASAFFHYVGYAIVDKAQPFFDFKGGVFAEHCKIVFVDEQAQSRRFTLVNKYRYFVDIITAVARELRIRPSNRLRENLFVDFFY